MIVSTNLYTQKFAGEPFVNQKVIGNTVSKVYYDYINRSLRGNKEIFQIDEQGRFYHILTSVKRELKDYLNIRLSLDCKNSHPLLFNFIILYVHNKEVSFSYQLSCALHQIFSNYNLEANSSTTIYHYDGKYIRNALLNSGIQKDKIADFTDDELQYMYETTNGIFWDNICREHPEFERSEIKVKMFAEVFYSNKPQLSYKEFGQMFAHRYPTVYREIKRWKQPAKYPYIQKFIEYNRIVLKKPTAGLSVSLMVIEANIFRSILASLYRKRYHAVHIHDCIIIPETGKKHQPSEVEVREIMLKEYAKYGLVPTLAH